MKTNLPGICPLCGKAFLRSELHAHILGERAPIRHGTIREISARYPGWMHEHGACRICWESHRALTRMPGTSELLERPPQKEYGFLEGHAGIR